MQNGHVACPGSVPTIEIMSNMYSRLFMDDQNRACQFTNVLNNEAAGVSCILRKQNSLTEVKHGYLLHHNTILPESRSVMLIAQ